MKIKALFAALLAFAAAPALIEAATTYPPGYEASLPVETLQPHLPAYLPNGAVNLDEVWTLDGGARLYWNTVRIPRQLNMGGAVWVDPALVPDLTIQPKAQPKRRYYSKRRSAKKVAKVKVPRYASSRSLTPPAIPLPVTPMPQSEQIQPLAPQAEAVPPPRLQ